MDKQPCVYILSSANRNVLYIGVTSQLQQRIWQHRTSISDSFTSKYNVNCLVFYEIHQTMEAAIYREKQLKSWRRNWKDELIKSINPYWRDLYDTI
ncbi:GIY-YIG nuclease family protein [Vibrio pacinii]|uniref:GIY-YIG nuclease family protein n=1 Tax=Vibrio pacinii TaxID=170674 RepID=UPI000570B77C|nr:GIY-YIG nuclease family protein [Vibrio pacinii]